MPVVSLSDMMMVTGVFSETQSSKPVIPEWVNVESPINATACFMPASAAPFAMVMEAPMSTHELIEFKGGKADKV